MQKLAQICIRRPVFATMLILALVVMGLDAYRKLGVDLFPKIEFPTVTINTTLRGAAPVEWAILRGLEKTGVTIMQMEAGMDSGPIIHQIPHRIDAEVSGGELSDHLAEMGAQALVEALFAACKEHGIPAAFAADVDIDDSTAHFVAAVRLLGAQRASSGLLEVVRAIRDNGDETDRPNLGGMS